MNAHLHHLRGRSMWPLAAPFEAWVAPVRPDDLVVGDLIAFVAHVPGECWLHRVTEIRADGVLARGDTNLLPDPLVPWPAILGRVTAIGWQGRTLPLLGPHAPLLRRLGLSWARVAPPLRVWYRDHVLARNAPEP